MGGHRLFAFVLPIFSAIDMPPRPLLLLVTKKEALRGCTSNAGPLYRDFTSINLSHGWLATRVLLRSLFFSMILISIPFLYLIHHGDLCGAADVCGGGDDCAPHKSLILSSPPFKNHGEFSIIQPELNTISYEELLQLQLKKTQYLKLKKLWTTKAWRQKVRMFSDIFQALLQERLLSHEDKALCIGTGAGEEVMAMKELGMQDVIGINRRASPPLVREAHLHKQPFTSSSFDFEFSDAFDTSNSPDLFVAEIERTLKPGGVAAMLVSLAKWQNRVVLKGPLVDPVTMLFTKSKIVYVRKVESYGFDTLILFRKCSFCNLEESDNSKCSSFKQNSLIMQQLESLVMEEPSESWITSRYHLKNLKYLPHIKAVNPVSRHVYVDIGAGHIDSSINSWFLEHYPKSDKTFEIFAMDMERSFASSYALHPEIKFLPYVAWIRNESLHFKAESLADGLPMGGHLIQKTISAGLSGVEALIGVKLQGLDIAEWLKHTFSVDDFVILKMDVGGMEFKLLPRLLTSGAMCLIDELFLECHYDRKGVKTAMIPDYKRSYMDCVSLFQMLRQKGVVVHQWWW